MEDSLPEAHKARGRCFNRRADAAGVRAGAVWLQLLRRFRFRFLAAELRVCGRGERPVPLPGLRWDPAHGGAAGGRGVPVPSCGWELLSLGKGQSAALGVLRTLPSAKGRKQQQPNENKTAALKNKQKAERSWAVSVTGRGVCRALLRACCHTALSGWGCLLRLHP